MTLTRDGYQLRRYTTDGDFVFWVDNDAAKAARQIGINIDGLGKVDEEFGDKDLAVSLYKVPEGTEYDEFPYTHEWIQACGTAERLTVEVKRLEADGVRRMYTIGRPSAANESAQSETVYNGDTPYAVRPSEVLNAAEAIELFRYYYENSDVATRWNLREQPEFADAG